MTTGRTQIEKEVGTSDSALLARIEHGDELAMSQIYTRYSRLVYAVALRVLRDSGLAEDVLQEIFMQIWRSPASFRETRGSLQGWLAVIARNRAIDALRRRRPMESIEELALASPRNFAREAENALTLDRVKGVVENLPRDQRSALELAFFQGLTHSEIAEHMGAPLGTVKTRIRSALQTLGKALG